MSDSVTALSGKNGTAKVSGTELCVDVTGWNFEPTANAPKYASNRTSGHKVAVDAVHDFSGSVTTKVHKNGFMPFQIGSVVDLELHVDDSGINYVSATVLVTSHPIPCDINDGEPIEVQYSFEPRSLPTYHGILALQANCGGSEGSES